jgi:hypothetical protein
VTADVVLVPSTLALLPEYAGAHDPVADLRAACVGAVGWLVSRHPGSVRVVSAPLRPEDAARGVQAPPGERVARHLLTVTGFSGRLDDAAGGVLVVANGTARRTEKAPGHFDDRAPDFDEILERALRRGDLTTLRELDAGLADELWVRDWPALLALADLVDGPMEIAYSDDPYGVPYWVGRATCGC